MSATAAGWPVAESTSERQAAAATRTVTLLDEQADDLRAELVKLRSDLQRAQASLSELRDDHLREANEQLVLAALHAETIAEIAVNNLDELARSSQLDALTDTPNRALMLDRLEGAIALARRHDTRFAVLFIDLDHFKQINDTLGHAAGDEVLRLAALGLASVVRDSDTVSRHGGDEFLVLLAEVAHAPDAALVAAKMLSVLAEPKTVGGHELSLLASIGIAIYPEDGDDATTLIHHADAAMYHAKRHGRGRFEFHTHDSGSLPAADFELAPPDRHLEDLRKANEKLLIAALAAQGLEADAKAAHPELTKFKAMVAHELRNPLTPIRIAAGMLHYARTDPAQVSQLHDIIDEQVVHMNRLVNDLLDVSRIGTGMLRLDLSTVELAPLLGFVADAFRPAMDTRRQQLKMHLPASPALVRGDRIRLVEVFGNLLDNASKYTPEGGQITIEVVAREQVVAITISDSGIGIAADALPHVFDLFVHRARTPAHPNRGLGIGLAVARDLVEAHGGTIVASSAGAGHGSEFVVTLPAIDRPLH